MDSGAIKHMTLHKEAFDTYKIISPRNVRCGDDSIAEVIRMESKMSLELK